MLRKYSIGLFAIAVAIGTVAFAAGGAKKDAKAKAVTNFYFKFTGTRNLQEGDNTKWDPISQAEYDGLTCGQTHLGCALIANDTVMISTVARPKAVYLATGTNDPIAGTFVSIVSNYQP